MIYPLRSIVAGVATLQEEDPILRPAIDIAARTGAMLHLVHAFDLPVVAWDAYSRMGALPGSGVDEYSATVSARLEAQVRRITSRSKIRCHAVAGPAPVVIRETALGEQADLILVGATRHGRLARKFLGTTGQRVLRGAPAPVLVLRGPLSPHLRRVLLTTDLSEFSAGIHEAALDAIETLFPDDHPALRSLLVVTYEMQLPSPLRRDMLGDIARERLGEFLDSRRRRAVEVEAVVRFGDPAREIVAEAAGVGADLLVMGTHGRPASTRWVLGSVAEAALRSAPVNVLVIPSLVEERRTLPVPRTTGQVLATVPPPAVA